MDAYEQQLLEGWEDVHKKGQLTLWILLSLKSGSKHMAEVKSQIFELTNGTLHADDKSMYRALRRFEEAYLVSYRTETNNKGPDRKIYYLTDVGSRVLARFVERNITDIYSQPIVKQLLQATVQP